MSYVANTKEDQQAMLEAIGAGSIEHLFAGIPASIRLSRPLELPAAMGELELSQHMAQLANRNQSAEQSVCFLGGGSYDHFIPAVVDALASRGEFYTSYTPYQPEVSQGNLQAMFEYQTLICQLTGMEVSNASLYDGGSATAEAALMSISATRSGQQDRGPRNVASGVSSDSANLPGEPGNADRDAFVSLRHDRSRPCRFGPRSTDRLPDCPAPEFLRLPGTDPATCHVSPRPRGASDRRLWIRSASAF